MNSLIARIQRLIETDDYDQSERLEREYEDGNAIKKQILDDAFICLCGYGLGTLLRDPELGEHEDWGSIGPPS